jgi:hypothetical protein
MRQVALQQLSGTVTVNAKPTPTVNSPTICSGNTATLTATGGTSYLWSNNATTASILGHPEFDHYIHSYGN